MNQINYQLHYENSLDKVIPTTWVEVGVLSSVAKKLMVDLMN